MVTVTRALQFILLYPDTFTGYRTHTESSADRFLFLAHFRYFFLFVVTVEQ